MRWVILSLVGVWSALTVVGYLGVLPDRGRDEPIIVSYLSLAGGLAGERESLDPRVRGVIEAFEREAGERGIDLGWMERGGTLPPPGPEREAVLGAFRAAYAEAAPGLELPALGDVPTLVWSTDDNPARPLQCALFRRWHLRTYGEPIDIITDPSNRDMTKAIVQCVAGAGPDVIEAYGPAQLQQIVATGLAYDVTEIARERGFDVSRIFETAIPSVAVEGRQYGFPCNIGYTVLFYHKDMFRRAGLPEPPATWDYGEFLSTCEALAEAGVVKKPFVFVNFTPWDMTLSLGIDFLNDEATASFYNQPASVAALQAYLDLVYRHKVSPTPAEAASKATSGGANMNADAQSASASAFFMNKDAAMVIDGRWQYVSMAQKNFTVIREAIDRRLAELDRGSAEAGALLRARAKIGASPLNVLSEEEYDAVASSITDSDRSRMLEIGVTHVPTVSGVPFYKANARIAVANASSARRAYAVRFLEFLASEAYNEQINASFDSICGMPEYCFDEDGISGPPRPLPGLEAFDSPVFAEAVRDYAHPDRVSPYIGQARLGDLVTPFMTRLQSDSIEPAEAARDIEGVLNRQIAANLVRDASLRARWERETGKTFDPERGLREQLEAGGGGGADGAGTRDEGPGS